MNKFDIAANLALFLQEKTGSIFGTFRGTLKAKEQRELFGMFIGKGMIVISGEDETIEHIRKVCFGMDYDLTFHRTWANINLTSEEMNEIYSREKQNKA